MQQLTIENLKEHIEQLNIFELRQTARAVGIEHSASDKKAAVQAKIIAIANGTANPVPCENPASHNLQMMSLSRIF